MNYFAHGRHFLHHPYLLAGTAVPDWLNVVDRRSRARQRSALRYLAARDQRIAWLAAGIVRHHQDDAWFHQTRAFAELSWSFTVAIRDRLPSDDGLRPSFLGHILVELLLDAELIDAQPDDLDRYYASIGRVDGDLVTWAVSRIASRPVPHLARWVERFLAERFLKDYLEDAKLLFRLNRIMQRVGLPLVPAELGTWLWKAREELRPRLPELLGEIPSGELP